MSISSTDLHEAANARADVLRIDLSRSPRFDRLTEDEFAEIYNGYGPDSWPQSIRAAVTWIYRNFEPLAAVHDVDFHFSDGSKKGWLEATSRWAVNISLMLDDRYPISRWWTLPVRAYAWAKLRASWRALQIGSWPAWTNAAIRSTDDG